MGIKCGIVGLPNVGKSTLFSALTQTQVDAQNYPFCTIDPNVGVVPVPDPRLDAISAIVNPKQILPTTMEFVDIAGLVKGASKGEGLGNQFLANIRQTDAIAHVVRCFEDENITHVDGNINPQSDVETINTELLLADLESVEKACIKGQKNAKSGNKEAKAQLEILQALKQHLGDGKPARTFEIEDEQASVIKQLFLLTIKPIMYIANIQDLDDLNNTPYQQIQAIAKQDNAQVVPICAAAEAELTSLDETDKAEFLQALGLEEPGLNKVIRAGYTLLGLQTFFTAGEKEVRAWTTPVGASAPQAAGCIHTDFEKGFIRAEVIGYDDYITNNGETGAKEAGKWRLEGKEYTVQDGDVIHFRFNT